MISRLDSPSEAFTSAGRPGHRRQRAPPFLTPVVSRRQGRRRAGRSRSLHEALPGRGRADVLGAVWRVGEARVATTTRSVRVTDPGRARPGSTGYPARCTTRRRRAGHLLPRGRRRGSRRCTVPPRSTIRCAHPAPARGPPRPGRHPPTIVDNSSASAPWEMTTPRPACHSGRMAGSRRAGAGPVRMSSQRRSWPAPSAAQRRCRRWHQ